MITKVDEKLYRGPHPTSIAELKAIGITLVIDLQTALDDVSYVEDVNAANQGIVVSHMPISDFRFPSWDWIASILHAIRAEIKKGGTVYVHCTHGVDRTGLICCIYRIIDQSWKIDEAIGEWVAMGMHKFPYLWPLNWQGKVRERYRTNA